MHVNLEVFSSPASVVFTYRECLLSLDREKETFKTKNDSETFPREAVSKL